jgi:CysZ protein
MPTFRDGLSSLLFGFRFLLRRPQALPFAAVPVLVVMVLSGLAVYGAIRWALPAVRELSPAFENDLGRVAVGLLSWVATLLVATIGIALSFVLAPTLSAPALERLVTLVEEARGAPPRAALGWVREAWLGLRASLIGLLVFSPVLALLLVLELVLPVVAVVTLPVRIVVASLWVAYALFDYPQSLRGYPIRARFHLLRHALAPVLGFGLGCSALFWLPCLAPLVLPVGVIAASELFWRIVSANPALAAVASVSPAMAAADSGGSSASPGR